jgi:hypothetical protein
MASAGNNAASSGPANQYTEKLIENRSILLAAQKRDRSLGYAKLGLLVVIFFAAIALVRTPLLLLWLLIPVVFLGVLAALHERVLQGMRGRNRVLAFYERGLERLGDAWAGKGETGDRFLDAAHPYARDLDIFGRASLFELLCTARTRAGEEILAEWLLQAAAAETIRARQAAVEELRDRVAFREQLFAAGDSTRVGVHPKWLAEWGETSPELGPPWLRPLLVLLGAAWLVSAVMWVGTSTWIPLVILTAANLTLERMLGSGVLPFVRATEHAAVDLKILAGVLAAIEKESFAAPLLCNLQSQLRTAGQTPSAAIRKLSRIVTFVESRRNLIVRVVNRPTFYLAQAAFAAEAWRARHGVPVRRWLAIVGEIEALTALSTFAFEHPAAIFPEIVDNGPLFEAEDFAHPLLPESRAVRNNLRLDGEKRIMVISGPNMAGKSTFVRGVGISVVLAQCGSAVQARRLRMSPLVLGASICVLDSLQGGVSRFYAEIQRLKLIFDLTGGTVPVMFLLDELLSGTNSHDRLAGTQFLVKNLAAKRAIGLITTHDLALTQIPEAASGLAMNCHFADHLENGELKFDYRLKPGVVRTSNALRLMQSIGLAVGEPEA